MLLSSDISAYKQLCLLDLVIRFVFMWNKIFVARMRVVHNPIVSTNPVKSYIIFSTRYTFITQILLKFIHYTHYTNFYIEVVILKANTVF